MGIAISANKPSLLSSPVKGMRLPSGQVYSHAQ
jgi:hypothetical protein